MTYTLGITEGHDAGATLLKDGKIVAAVNEERLNRQKMFCGLPILSINKVLEIEGIKPIDIDGVGIAGTLGVMARLSWDNPDFMKKLYMFICKHSPNLVGSMFFANLQRNIFEHKRGKVVPNYLESIGILAPYCFYDHHKCHAASAYYTCGKKHALIITSDGSGDGLSSSVYVGNDGHLELIKEISTFHSLGYYYAYVTNLLGWRMFLDEGKCTGLAAHGRYKDTLRFFDKCIDFIDGQPVNKLQLMGTDVIKYIKKSWDKLPKVNWAAGIQKKCEQIMRRMVDYYIKKTTIRDVAVAGGLFANVRINQAILESPYIDSLFIHPHMGDGGIATGAAFLNFTELNELKPYKLNNVFFGPSYTDMDYEKALEGLSYTKEKNIAKTIAEKIADKKVVARFYGRMEYGPRALGNRSLLADPTDKKINDMINKRLVRTETMPLAPSILDTSAAECFDNWEKGKYPSEFMTITFNGLEASKPYKAVMHLDNTARPQVVTPDSNPQYYEILKEYQKITGNPLFVNTSFNMHGEPIVCSPEDAVRSFKKGCADYLAIGDYFVEGMIND